MKVLPECVVNFAQLRRVSQLGQVTSKHQSGLTWGPPPSPWPLSKKFINLFPNYLLFFPKHSFALHNISFPQSFIQCQILLFVDTLQWPLSNSCHPSPVKYHPSLLEKPFLEWLDPAISWESFSSKSGTEHQEQLWSCKRRNATKLFVLWQLVFHNQFDLPNKRKRLSKWFDERCLIERQWGRIEKVNTCVQ